MKPLVSIIVPVYNAEKYLDETIISIVHQTLQNIEIILVNDGSSDSSGDICDTWKKRDSRIEVIHTINRGPSAARNTGISIAKGEFILPVDSDDLIDTMYAQKAAAILNSNPEIGIVYCKAMLIGDSSGEWMIPEFSVPEILVKNCIFATAMYRKKDWEITGGYSEIMKAGLEDYDLWLSIISLKRKVYQLPEFLFYYRKHDKSRSVVFETDKNVVKNTEEIRFYRHKKLYEDLYYVPETGKRVALYGAGGAGQTYYEFLRTIDNHSIKCCVDKKYDAINDNGFDIQVESPAKLLKEKYDLVIVAINKDDTFLEIKKWLLDSGYEDDQVYWYIDIDKLSGYTK